MPVLPVPMIIALLLFGLLVNRFLARETSPILLVLIGTCALQSALVAMIHYYGFSGLRPVQPVLASLIPAIAWLAFRLSSLGQLTRYDLALNALAPTTTLLSVLVYPAALDILIPALFAAYGMAIMVMLRRGEDALPNSPLEFGRMTALVWRILALSLIISAASDAYIAVQVARGDVDVLLWLPSLMSSLTLFVLGGIAVSHALGNRAALHVEHPTYSAEAAARDESIMKAVGSYFDSSKPYLDPDLTLTRLARKLGVPEKQLSSAINKTKGENVSRFVNAYRIRHACALIRDGASVTDAMLRSGFNTKSNFNREFLRVQGMNPRRWLASLSEGQDRKGI